MPGLAQPTPIVMDGNEAVARVAYAASDTICLYPITPASPMGEHADAWAARGRENLWGSVPQVVQLQSEAGAAGALHGAVQAGALGTTFTASQGLLLMLPNMFKIAGELTPAVIHVAARTVATHALSIFGDHSDVMAVRAAGWAILFGTSPQEAHDLAAVAHAATLRSRVPFLHAMDGFQTSHELANVVPLADEDLAALIDGEDVIAHRRRGLDPDHPTLRGSAQNPDVYFQAREAINPTVDAVPDVVRDLLRSVAVRTGRSYDLVEHHGAPDATRVVVVMGSASGTVREVVDRRVAAGDAVGMCTVRLYRPFPSQALVAALPETVTHVAVLDRTKEPGAVGEPLFTDVVAALADAVNQGDRAALPRIIGGRYGLSSKAFTPAMADAVFAELGRAEPRRRFTVGITDDVTKLSLAVDDGPAPVAADTMQIVLHGLGSDGTVGATKNTAKILAETAGRSVQAAFVYDSKKSGATTESHLRIANAPIRSAYLIDQADVVGCHQFGLLERRDLVARLRPGGIFLLNAPFAPDDAWEQLPGRVQRQLIDKQAQFFVLDAYALARDAGIAGRINTVMQVALFEVARLLDHEVAMEAIRTAAASTYADLGEVVVARNLAAIDAASGAATRVPLPAASAPSEPIDVVARAAALRGRPLGDVDDFVRHVTGRMLAGEGDRLPVSALPVDGTFPTGTARWEKRSLAEELPSWDPDLCIDCGKCAIVCPHAAIQIKLIDGDAVGDLPDVFAHKPFADRSLAGHHLTVQVAPDDCTGCGVCVETCPAVSRQDRKHKALDMVPAVETRARERERWSIFESLPYLDRGEVRHDTVKHAQTLQPLFEASGACAGCGETPYLKLLSQLFGDRTVVANATGCSSIYGGNLPTTPWGTNADGRGPAWSNSLFEDNAEFGLGIRLGIDEQRAVATVLLARLAGSIGDDLVSALLGGTGHDEATIAAQRERVAELRRRLAGVDDPLARQLDAVAGALVHRSVWIVGGDGWAYDIGFGGLDHVLASGANVNVLVLDTEVYSNTGGQASKATARGAVAKFATAGKPTAKKDLGLLAMQYGNVYIAQIALGANEMQTVKAFHEAEAWPGPSLLLAYSTCIAHGIDMRQSMTHMDLAVRTGYWPLYRFHPDLDPDTVPFHLDSAEPSLPLSDLLHREGRFAVLERTDPHRAEHLFALAQQDVDERWHYYRQLATVGRRMSGVDGESDTAQEETT